MLKKTWLCMILIGSMFILGACAKAKNPSETNTVKSMDVSNAELNVLVDSLRYDKLFKNFTAKTGCKINPVLNENISNAFYSLNETDLKNIDVVYHASIYALDKGNEKELLRPIPPIDYKTKDKKFTDSNGYWISDFIHIYPLFINADVQQELKLELPKKINDIENTRYRKEIALLNPYYQGFTVYNYLRTHNENFSREQFTYANSNNENLEYLKDSSRYGGVLSVSKTVVDQCYRYNTHLVQLESGVPWEPRIIVVPLKSSKEKVAQVFLNFLFSKEAQRLLAEIEGADTHQLANEAAQGYDLGLDSMELLEIDHKAYLLEKEEKLVEFLNNN